MKKNIIKSIKIFFVLLMFHFLGITFLRFVIGEDLGLTIFQYDFWNLWKEIFLIIIFILILLYNYKKHRFNLKEYFASKNHIKITLLILIFSIIGIAISLLNHISLKAIILGIKYDVLMLMPIIFFPMLKFTKDEFNDFLKFFSGLAKFILVISLLFFIVRSLEPRILHFLGFAKPNQEAVYSRLARPPYYYGTIDTYHYSLRRESGVFSGPNAFAFWLSFIFPILFGMYYFTKRKQRNFSQLTLLLLIFLLIVSYSRSALISFFLELILIVAYLRFFNLKKISKKIKYLFISMISIIGIFTIVGVITGALARMVLRFASTGGHIQNLKNAIIMFTNNPFGLGFGTAGPAAVQMSMGILPENRYLQIFLETGIFGGIIYSALIIFVIYSMRNIRQKTDKSEKIKNYLIFIIIGFIGILSSGMFLHIFDDSMVSYFIACFIGLYLGLQNENNQ